MIRKKNVNFAEKTAPTLSSGYEASNAWFGWLPSMTSAIETVMVARTPCTPSAWYNSDTKAIKGYWNSKIQTIRGKGTYIPATYFATASGVVTKTVFKTGGPPAFKFQTTAIESIKTTLYLNDIFDATQALSCKVHWATTSTATTASGTVWRIRYLSRATGEAMTATYVAVTGTTSKCTGANDLVKSAAISIPASALAVDDLLVIAVDRLTTATGDNLGKDAYFLGLSIE